MDILREESPYLSELGFATWRWEILANKLLWSPGMFKLFGVEESTFSGAYEAWEQILHPDDKQRAIESWKQTFAEKKNYHTRFRIISPKIGLRYIEAKAMVEYGESDEPLVMRGVSWDVTEQFKLEGSYADLSFDYELVIRSLVEGLIIQRPSGVIIRSNKAAQNIFGMTDAEIYGRTPTELNFQSIHPDGTSMAPEEHPCMRSLKTGEIQRDVVVGLVRDDGSCTWISVSSVPRFNKEGKISDTVTTFVDVTAKINLQRDLEEQASLLRQMLDSARYMFIATDTDGNIIHLNSTAEKLLGYSSYELVGKETWVIFHDREEINEVTNLMNKIFSLNIEPGFKTFAELVKIYRNDEREWTYVRKDGQRFPVHLSITDITDTNGNNLGYLGVGTDITREKELEHEIELKNEAMIFSAKMASLGQLSAGIAHEINNPLTVIIGKTEQLKYMIKDGDSISAVTEELDKIAKTSVRIGRIIDSLRCFSGALNEAQAEVFDISDLIIDIYNLVKDKMAKKAINFEFGPPEVAQIIGKKNQILQSLLNIFTNAIEAVEDLKEKWIKVDVDTRNHMVRVSITDSGVGIDKDTVDKMMTPFFSTKQASVGVGLGLSIALGNIESNGGKLYYETHNGHTTFVIELPQVI